MTLPRRPVPRRSSSAIWVLVVFLMVGQWAEAASATSPLAQSISPYLRLHAGDPVAWREWSPELLEEARATGLPLFLSSGYYACHWCHVMQEESFKDAGIAQRLNRGFIPVKIDRDLHGALDNYLLEFLRATRGSAGWPLNVVVLPTGDALSGVVYAPRDDFARFLDLITQRLRADGEALTALAREGRLELTARLRDGEEPLSDARIARLPRALWQSMEREVDLLAGGFGDQSKFPRVPALDALLIAHVQGTAPDWAGEFLQVTLDEMAGAGLRDVLGGGFFRYSETPDWGRPHFEIMLEDQAQLAGLYLRAGRLLDRPEWLTIGRETLRFVLRDMVLDGMPGFASALSAVDGSGREGGVYLWTDEQLNAALREHPRPEVARALFALEGAPSFDAGYLPKRRADLEAVAKEHGLPAADTGDLLMQGRRLLLQARSARDLPRDEKPLTGTHGLMLSALAEALGDPELQAAGAALASWLREHAATPDRLSLLLDTPRAVAGAAELADFAYLAQGLHDWARAQGETTDPVVTGLLDAAWTGFADSEGWRASREPPLPGMVSERFHPAVHRPSPVTLILNLSRAYLEESDLLAGRLAEFDLRPGRAIESTPIAHAGLILWLVGN